jgi:hypothetical protein
MEVANLLSHAQLHLLLSLRKTKKRVLPDTSSGDTQQKTEKWEQSLNDEPLPKERRKEE